MVYSQLHNIAKLNGKKFPFTEVIKQVEDRDVKKFDNPELLANLKKICDSIIAPINAQKGVDQNFPKRPNEFGNYVEPFFRDKCNASGISCQKPKTKSGKIKSSGYPDCLLKFDNGYCYVEIKTCEEGGLESTFRSFFYSPSMDSKIVHDAPHLLIGFETLKNTNQLNGTVLFADMFDKTVTLKLEYNTNNKTLYTADELL